jgi:hypothetical protein
MPFVPVCRVPGRRIKGLLLLFRLDILAWAFSMTIARAKISSTDLLWVFQERLASFDDRFKRAPIAIVPSNRGWHAVKSRGYTLGEPQLSRRIQQVQAELEPIYRLTPD